MEPRVGSTISLEDQTYRVQRYLGSGALSIVFLAVPLFLENAEVVIKIAREDSGTLRSGHQEAMLHEGEILARLNSAEDSTWSSRRGVRAKLLRAQETAPQRRIIALLDSGTMNTGQPFLVLEKAPPPLEPAEINTLEDELRMLGIFSAVASGMELAHQHGIALRDLAADCVRVQWLDDRRKQFSLKLIDWNVTGGPERINDDLPILGRVMSRFLIGGFPTAPPDRGVFASRGLTLGTQLILERLFEAIPGQRYDTFSELKNDLAWWNEVLQQTQEAADANELRDLMRKGDQEQRSDREAALKDLAQRTDLPPSAQEVLRSLVKAEATAKGTISVCDVRGIEVKSASSIYQCFLDERYRPLTEHLIIFDDLIAESTADFVGRAFLDAELAAFMDHNDRGYFVLVGEPGIGKTAWAAHIVRERQALCHFNVSAMGIIRPEQCLRNLCAQLIARFQLDQSYLPVDAGRDESLLYGLLRQAVERLDGGKLLVVIDALNEAQMPSDKLGANALYLPRILPVGTYIVVTQRPVPVVLAVQAPRMVFRLDSDSPENLADVQTCLERYLERPEVPSLLSNLGVSESQFVDVLLERSQGNLLYLRFVLSELTTGRLVSLQSNPLPPGLTAYFQLLIEQLHDLQEWETLGKPVLAVLAAASTPLSVDEIAEISGIQTSIPRIERFLDYCGACVAVEHREGVTRYRLYHRSLNQYLAETPEFEAYISANGQASRDLDQRGVEQREELTRNHSRKSDGFSSHNAYALVVGLPSKSSLWSPSVAVRNDALDLRDVLTDPQYAGYPTENVELLIDDQATRAGVLHSIQVLASKASAESTILLYFSGEAHAPSEVGYETEHHLLTADSDVKSIPQTSLSVAELSRAVQSIPARSVLIILDVPHAGGFRLRGRGRLVLASCEEDELSWVLPGHRNSLFTHHLLAALSGGTRSQDGLIRVLDLFDYLRTHVTQEPTNQHPTLSGELEGNFPIALCRGGFTYDVFISYSHSDLDWVQNWLLPRLEAAKLRVCVDYRDFDLGVPSVVNMERATDKSRHVLLVLTPQWLKSEWTNHELLQASVVDPANRTRKLIPLMLAPCQLPSRLGFLTYADFTEQGRQEQEFKRILQALGSETKISNLQAKPDYAKGQTQYDVFISYADADQEWVRTWLVPHLRDEGTSVCVDYDSFEVGLPRLINMERAVNASRFLLIVLTEAYVSSQWSDYEAVLLQKPNPESLVNRVLPVLRGNCRPPRRISHLAYVDLAGKSDAESELSKLLDAMRGIRLLPDVCLASRTLGLSFDLLQHRFTEQAQSIERRYRTDLIRDHSWQVFRGIYQFRSAVRLPLATLYVEPTIVRVGDAKEAAVSRAISQATEIRDDTATLSGSSRKHLRAILSDSYRLVILGEPGSGKTTLLRYITLMLASNQGATRLGLAVPYIPVIAKLADFARALEQTPSLSLDHYLLQIVAEMYPEDSRLSEFLRLALERGLCLVMLDGLDELSEVADTSSLRRSVALSVQQFADRYCTRDEFNHLIITSRVVGYWSHPLKAFDHVILEPFLMPDDVEHFLLRWFTASEQDNRSDGKPENASVRARQRVSELLPQLMETPGLSHLAQNPLLLTILVLNHENIGHLPSERVRLYNLCVRTLLESWREEQTGQRSSILNDLGIGTTTSVMAALAYRFHEQRPSGVATMSECREWLSDILVHLEDFEPQHAREKATSLLSAVEHEVGILEERGQGLWGFVHLTLEEYLAARHLSHQSPDVRRRMLRSHWEDVRWHEVICLGAGHMALIEARYGETADLLNDLLDSAPSDPANTGLPAVLAGRALVDIGLRRIPSATTRRVIEELQRVGEEADSRERSTPLPQTSDRTRSAAVSILAVLNDQLTDTALGASSRSQVTTGAAGSTTQTVVSHVWHARLSSDTPARAVIGQQISVELQLSTLEQSHSVSLQIPANSLELTVYVEAPTFHLVGEHTKSLPLLTGIPNEHSLNIDLIPLVSGEQQVRVLLYPGGRVAGVTPVKLSIPVRVIAPKVLPNFPELVDRRTIPDPQPDVMLYVTLEQTSEGEQVRLHLTCPVLSLDRQPLDPPLALTGRDLAGIRQAAIQTATEVNGAVPGGALAALRAFGATLFDQLMPPGHPLRQFYRQIRGLELTPHWLVISDEQAALPWELVCPYGHSQETGEVWHDDFFARRFILSHWVGRQGLPLVSETPLAMVALAHYGQRPSELPRWATVLGGANVIGIEDQAGHLSLMQTGSPYYGLHVLRYAAHGQEGRITHAGHEYPEERDFHHADARAMLYEQRLDFTLRHPMVGMSFVEGLPHRVRPGLTDSNIRLETGWMLPFMHAGASALIGSRWTVPAEVDQIFFTTFYRAFRSGAAVGDAVWHAREQVRTAFPRRSDWLAYAHFGHPQCEPYLVRPSQGFVLFESLDNPPEASFETGLPYRFRASYRGEPPVWYEGRLRQQTALPSDENVSVLVVPLSGAPPETYPLEPIRGSDDRQRVITLTMPDEAGTLPVLVRFLRAGRELQTLMLNLDVVEKR